MQQVVPPQVAGQHVDVEALQARERIAVAAAAAMFAAGVILMAFILPAEYGVDPLGTGGALGLTQMAEADAAPAAVPQIPAAAAGPAGGLVASGNPLEPTRVGANTPQPGGFREDSRTFDVPPGEGIEYKYQMEQGGSFVYEWTATGRVKSEFHGEPVGAPKGYAEFYEKIEGERANGSFFAATTGIHGWYWENLTDDPVTVTLTTAGFYTGGIHFSASGRTEYPITD